MSDECWHLDLPGVPNYGRYANEWRIACQMVHSLPPFLRHHLTPACACLCVRVVSGLQTNLATTKYSLSKDQTTMTEIHLLDTTWRCEDRGASWGRAGVEESGWRWSNNFAIQVHNHFSGAFTFNSAWDHLVILHNGNKKLSIYHHSMTFSNHLCLKVDSEVARAAGLQTGLSFPKASTGMITKHNYPNQKGHSQSIRAKRIWVTSTGDGVSVCLSVCQ